MGKSIFSVRRARRAQQGFTLIELMVAVAIVGILAAVAVPSYTQHMQKSRRAEAQSYLMDLSQRQQQYLLDMRSYAATEAALNMTTPASVAKNYTIAIAVGAGTPPTFTITATPKAGSAQAGDVTLSINNANAKLPAGYW
ncbi:MAG: type IV pilin protein [Pseudomonadota bacterium]